MESFVGTTDMKIASQRSIRLLAVLLLLLHHSDGLRLGQWGTLLSLSESLISRVANIRDARGDHAGADRARKVADKIHHIGGGWGLWSTGWDFAWNYALHGGIPSTEIYRSASQIVAALTEFRRLESREERARWVLRNYSRLVNLSETLFRTLLRYFSRSGPVREAVLALQKEIVEGELLRDCLELSAADLEGLLRIAADMLFSSASHQSEL
ncbi:hypothetical protein HPP92_009092 [Vanilla planifolia]|uniref:Uncharacterized protein n=1 Tax=Vanilla planifolia TaxID=51239 RepID=A0A835REK9_VANPL|nr:hypothetical protein HPP92_009092 [Vanilla planifolia]